jgi:hypothetical protein
MTHQILIQFDKLFLTYCCTGILWYIGILSTECPFKKIIESAKSRDGFTGGGGCTLPLALARGGAGGMLFFMIKQKRQNEIQ